MFQKQSLIAQQQRQTQTSSQGFQSWNGGGSQWAAPQPPAQQQAMMTAPIPPPDTALPPTPPHMSPLDIKSATLSDFVAHYSAIYQFHAQQMASCRATGSIHGDVYKWAEYYCDLSTRAAHHYNDLTQQRRVAAVAPPTVGQQGAGVKQASYASVAAAAAPGTVTSVSRSVNKATRTTERKPDSGAQGGIPDSFKDYFHRNMNQCTSNTTQSKSMEELIRLKMEQSLNANTMHTTNWFHEPLIPIPSSSHHAANSNSTFPDAHSISSNSFPSSNSTNSKTKAKRKRQSVDDPYDYQGKSKKGKDHSQKLVVNDSYYGKPLSKTNPNNPKHFETSMGDFVSLSSVTAATAASVKKKKATSKSNIAVLVSKKKKREKTLDGFQSSKSKLASRADRFSGAGGISSANSSHDYMENVDKYMGKSVIGGSMKKLNGRDYEKMTVKGRCQVLEKPYLRLTAPPKAELVRPEPILKQHLDNLKQEWTTLPITSKRKKKKIVKERRDYNWFCSQLKAIRQDLTVQRIFNTLAVQVYEFHAGIALEEGDLNEYNQSQTQLKELYDLLRHKDEKEGLKNHDEFIAYRIIYYVFLTGNEKYDGGSSDLFKIMLNLTGEQKKSPFILHALNVRRAVTENDYHAFFKLRQTCPNKGPCLMNLMLNNLRVIGLKRMMKAYLSLNVDFILRELGFVKNGNVDLNKGTSWLKDCGCKFNDGGNTILTKESVLNESFLSGNQTSSLI